MADSTQYLPPKGEYERFENEAHYLDKVKEWGLSAKREFWFKDRNQQSRVTIRGYEAFGMTGEYNTLVIEFPDGNLTCIHPAYLKEMQSSSFSKELAPKNEKETQRNDGTVKETAPKPVPVPAPATNPKAGKQARDKKEKPKKLVLPEEKVHFSATVKQFALSWNHFNEMNDEVVVFEDVRIALEEPVEVGLAWGSHSKTLKKHELEPGDQLEFDGKIIKKSLPKGKDVEDESMLMNDPVAYKINNPSKITKK
ncbi:hypothetical protein [Bacillus sp. REN3]|uniref:hypothetical protein n=1 Tax=Bacillus sp. REN3 TaxID=2802440 RepID=UPI001AEE69E8|nr:hypothetical protein [Bacillus sp. REN3]